MEFLVEFDTHIPDGTSDAEIEQRQRAEASAAARLASDGHLVRVWRTQDGGSAGRRALGLYRADGEAQLDALLRCLPLHEWMQITVTPLEPHPNDPPQS